MLESPYPAWDGLNLTWDTLEGLAKHNGPVRHPAWALQEADAAFPLDLGSWPSLEAQIAAIADDIAYDNHDIDDGLRAGLLDLDALCTVPFVRARWSAVTARHPDCAKPDRLRRELVRDQIGVMVNDVIEESRRRIGESGLGSVAEVRAAGRQLVGFSPAMAADERALKRFMYATLYHSASQVEVANAARNLLTRLFEAYAADPSLLPESWRAMLPTEEPARTRHVADFIAGMTDRYAIARHVEVVGPVAMPEGF
jgi:dGTPase